MLDYPPVTQFPDLTEVQYMPESWYGSEALTKEEFDAIKTEFIFFVAAKTLSPTAEEWGFKPVSCMNNWYCAHRREARRMTLYWMRNPNSTGEPQPAFRINWALNAEHEGDAFEPYVLDRKKLNQDSFLAASGCGFNIGEPPFVKRLFYQFPTLMRMPVEVKPIKKRWLVKHNYRLLDIGKLASYWVNGWTPEEYTYEKECAYFKVHADWSKIEPKKKEVKADGNR